MLYGLVIGVVQLIHSMILNSITNIVLGGGGAESYFFTKNSTFCETMLMQLEFLRGFCRDGTCVKSTGVCHKLAETSLDGHRRFVYQITVI